MSFVINATPSTQPDNIIGLFAPGDVPRFDADQIMQRFRPVLHLIVVGAQADREIAAAEYERLLQDAYWLRDEMARRISEERGLLTLTIRRIRLAHQAACEPRSEPLPIFEIGDKIKHHTNSALTGCVCAVHCTPLGRFYAIDTPDQDVVEIFETSAESI